MRLKHFLSVFLTLLTLGVGQMWALEANHTCSGTSGTILASKITWAATSATWNSPQCRIAANGTVAFTLTGVNVTSIAMGFSSSSYIGSDWSSSGGGSFSSNNSTVTWTGTAGAGTLTFTTSAAARLKTIKVTYTEAASCTNSVTLSKGSATNGTVNTISSTSVATCSATASDRRVTITITPSECFNAPDALTFTKSTGTVTATMQGNKTDNGNGTFSYVYQFNQNDNGSGTFGVNCTAKPAGRTVNFDAGAGTYTGGSLTEDCEGAGITLPSAVASGICKGWTTFAGWATAPVTDSTTTSGVTLYAVGDNFEPSFNGQTLYAVYSKSKGGSGFKLSLKVSNTTYYVGAKGSGDFLSAVTNSADAVIFTYENSYLSYDDSGIKKYISITGNNTSLYVTTDKPSVTWTESGSTTYSYLTSAATRYLAFNGSASPKRFASYNNNSSYPQYFTKHSAATTFYCSDPNCCSPLGSINGSVSFTNVSPTSVTVGVPSDYSDKDNANLEGYIFKRYAASTGGDALETIETDAANKTTATFNTGLVANTTYYYTIIAKHSSSSCNSAETSPRKSYKIDSYVVSYANGDGSGTNPGAHNPVLANGEVELKTNTFDAPTGKGFVNWSDGSNSYDEGEKYTVTANTTMTAQWECLEPGFTKNLSTAQVDYLQGETAAKLSVTAAANGAEMSYQWQMSPNGTSGWDNVGSNSNEYTPSTATAGHQYYHCIVTNLVDGCTDSKATSAVAHIHVDVPAACLQPSISVASGTYYEDKTVTITCGTVGAAIYYTTDGSTTPTSGSTLYEGAITIDHSMTIKAIAIKAGMDNSTVAEATYTIKCETPTIVLAAGNYTGVQTTTITKGYGTKIYYTTDGSTPSNTNGTEYTGAVSIDQPMTLKAIVWKDGCTNSEVASAAYTLKCTTPEFNKGTDTYTGAQSITLSGTAGADIYYTLDGTTPSKTNGTKYTAAISVSTNQTVKAIAVKDGWGDSEIASATYTIQYNVYWWVNGADWNDKGGSTLVTYGQTATAPTTAPTKANGCGDKFMGWTTEQNYEDDNTAPTGMFTETSDAITGETNFYAVFADYGEE